MMKTLFAFLALTAVSIGADFPAPKALTSPEKAGLGIQRTMQLLAGSTPEHRNTVRVLFYGQSITEQAWTKAVSEYLKTTYPDADLVIENRAIGGHSSQILVKTTEADVIPFQPDLLIFHVYGAHDKYEDLIKMVREKTCAEILIQTDHLSADQKIDEETDPTKLAMDNWAPWFNYVFLPSVAEKYQAELVPQRDHWKAYLRENELEPPALLKDGVHLNEHGEFLMAEIVKSHLVVHPEIEPIANKRVTTMDAVDWKSGELNLPFTGNRIDAIMAVAGKSEEVEVLIDGKKPSEIPSAYAFTKVTGYNRTNWPVLLRVSQGDTPPVPETWTVTLSDANEDYSSFRFSVSGSVTGPDGEGNATEDFNSKSGRIVIHPDDWNLNYSQKVFKVPHPADVPITFDVIPLHRDVFTAEAGKAPVTLAQNLKNGAHTLTLRAKSKPPIAAIRAFNPDAK